MKLGRLTFDKPFILAPLAGYTDLSFRLLCREQGAAFTISEMISCHGLIYGHEKTWKMLATVAAERPVGFQLFGSDPAAMSEAAAILSSRPIDFIDINMGCPVKKVVKKGSGVALMKDIDLAGNIIEAVCRATSLPVTVKFRSGWNHESVIAADFGKMAEQSGASMLTVHGRTWAQGFGGKADWDVIGWVKDNVRIPVIGNGDVLRFRDGQDMMKRTGCDGIMIGRGALGNPWVFQEQGMPQTFRGRQPVLLRHLELMREHMDLEKMLFKVKIHLNRYLSGLVGAGALRKQIIDCPSIDHLEQLLKSAG